MQEEFERQIQTLIDKDYPKLAGVSESKLRKIMAPLKHKIPSGIKSADFESGHLPFVIVIKSELVSSEKKMSAVEFNGKEGFIRLYPHEPEDFQIIDGMGVPNQLAYLLIDIDRGRQTLNIRPEDAFKIIESQKRFPLTIDEGIALITHFPEFLIKNNCFSLLASRTGKDQRVPAIWINANKQANLGWCWNRNPHTWLGSASVKSRVG